MGNQNNCIDDNQNPHNTNSKLSKFKKKICQFRGINTTKRVVFISLIGFYRSWQQVPSEIMNHCLLLLPLKQIWIYQPTKYMNEIRSSLIYQFSMFFPDPTETQKFIEMVKWKDSQGLVCWMLDYIDRDEYPIYHADEEKYPSDSSVVNPLIAAFWYHLSMKLTTLNDICTGYKYKPLILDVNWYRNKSEFIPKYGVTLPEILSELYFFKMKYRTIQELLYQSNPNLEPVIMYGQNSKNIMRQTTAVQIIDLYEEDHDCTFIDDDKGEWFISEDYDPYDL
eukprot:348937_1